jgi:hypothetical protein
MDADEVFHPPTAIAILPSLKQLRLRNAGDIRFFERCLSTPLLSTFRLCTPRYHVESLFPALQAFLFSKGSTLTNFELTFMQDWDKKGK